MLINSFAHLPGIGKSTAQRLNELGIFSWDDAIMHRQVLPFGEGLRLEFLRGLEESRRRLEAQDALWFSERLAQAEQWRLFPHFKNSAAYVDIETSGMAWPHAQITSIALYDGENLKVYVNGRNLDDFLRDIKEYTLLVTWNGRAFDVPFICRALQTDLKMAHIDLFPVFRSLGIKGGLKKVEKIVGLSRGELDGVDGYTAVQLWREYVTCGNPRALETLLAYNSEDVFSLEYLCYYACAKHGFPQPGEFVKPENPFHIDVELVARLTEERQAAEARRNEKK